MTAPIRSTTPASLEIAKRIEICSNSFASGLQSRVTSTDLRIFTYSDLFLCQFQSQVIVGDHSF